MNNKRGFTLIELLVVIALIAVVAGIGAYVTLNVIGKTREKSYKITINNIEQNASAYIIENKDGIYFTSIDDTYEYQCVTVQNLVSKGYLDNNVSYFQFSILLL